MRLYMSSSTSGVNCAVFLKSKISDYRHTQLHLTGQPGIVPFMASIKQGDHGILLYPAYVFWNT